MKKRILVASICLLSILIVLLNIAKISDALTELLTKTSNAKINIKNTYYKNSNYAFVNNTNDFTPYGKQDLLNIIYTMINNGEENFTLYCPKEYTTCLNDIKSFTDDDDLLTHINNFVHPYNSILRIETTINDSGEVNFKAFYLYNKEEINKINTEVDKILLDINKNLDKEKEHADILAVHDYIINNTKYDLENKEENKSYLAYGALFNHLATCNGYTDLMAIFLSKMGYDNYKVATTGVEQDQKGHVWNAIKIDDKWYHLDLTWDDPVDKKANHLYHKYFLLTSEQLEAADKNITSKEHEFHPAIYLELKKNNQ